ncbi:MAG: ABC transporter permease subunit [Proteobacteria bacterium]|nr:ABC transporter permease subunit [Pseudomonadota bacterium]MBS0573593.1 ABC transporter permease subunit [Pseudomonadota bacterium]
MLTLVTLDGAASAFDLLAWSPPGWGATLVAGLWNTILIASGAYALGLAIGVLGAFGKLYGGPVTKDLLGVYTTLVRAVPELVLILILNYAFRGLLNQALAKLGYPPVELSGVAIGIAILGVVQGAYSTEVLRGAILSVPAGQIEAARAMGMSPVLLARRITLPLMMAAAIPGLANLWLTVTKDTALLAVVGFIELTKATSLAAATTKVFFTFYMAGGVLYLILSLGSTLVFGRIERWARKGQRVISRGEN